MISTVLVLIVLGVCSAQRQITFNTLPPQFTLQTIPSLTFNTLPFTINTLPFSTTTKPATPAPTPAPPPPPELIVLGPIGLARTVAGDADGGVYPGSLVKFRLTNAPIAYFSQQFVRMFVGGGYECALFFQSDAPHR